MCVCVCTHVHPHPCKCECFISSEHQSFRYSLFFLCQQLLLIMNHWTGWWTSLQLLHLQVKANLSSTDASGSGVWLERTRRWQEGGRVSLSCTGPSSFRELDNTQIVMVEQPGELWVTLQRRCHLYLQCVAGTYRCLNRRPLNARTLFAISGGKMSWVHFFVCHDATVPPAHGHTWSQYSGNCMKQLPCLLKHSVALKCHFELIYIVPATMSLMR